MKYLFLTLVLLTLVLLTTAASGQQLKTEVEKNAVSTKFYIEGGFIRIEDTWMGKKRIQEIYANQLDITQIRVGEPWKKTEKSLMIYTSEGCDKDLYKALIVTIMKNGQVEISRRKMIDIQLKKGVDATKMIEYAKQEIKQQASYKRL